MASRTSFDKLQRERRKKAKAAAKRARRQGRSEETEDTRQDEESAPADDAEVLGPNELLRRVESLQSRLESGAITLDEFEEEKAELTDRLADIID